MIVNDDGFTELLELNLTLEDLMKKVAYLNDVIKLNKKLSNELEFKKEITKKVNKI